jgi:glutaredoxin
MYKSCPKCGYARKVTDDAPDWQCPACGVAYVKAGDAPAAVPLRAGYRPDSQSTGASHLLRLVVAIMLGAAFFIVGRHFYGPIAAQMDAATSVASPGGAARGVQVLSREEVVAMVGEANAIQLAGAGNSNPALVQRFVKVDRGNGSFSISSDYVLTERSSAKLASLTNERVVLFSTATCPYCAQARRYFSSAHVRYADLDIEANGSAAQFEVNVLGTNQYPVFVVNGRVLYGYNLDELKKAVGTL